MKAAPFDYLRPDTVEEACAHLAEADGGAAVLAGGQSLMPLLALRMSQPFILVDINRVAALKGVERGPGGLRIGAGVRQCEVVADGRLAVELPALVQAARHVGHHQTRARGTLGGSIALGEPAGELPAAAAAFGAVLELASPRGRRRVAAEDFYLGPYSTVLEADELLTAVHYPAWPADHRPLFREVALRPGDFALAGLVGALAVEGGRIVRAGLALFGMGPTPVKARRAEVALVGQATDALDTAGVAELAIADCQPFDDHHATAEYRRTVGRRILARALEEALGRRPVLGAAA